MDGLDRGKQESGLVDQPADPDDGGEHMDGINQTEDKWVSHHFRPLHHPA